MPIARLTLAGLAAGALLGLAVTSAAYSQSGGGDYFGTTTDEGPSTSSDEGPGERGDEDEGGYMPGEPAIDRYGRDSECGGTNRAYYDRMYGTHATVLEPEEANKLYRKGEVIRCGACPPDREICWLKREGPNDVIAQLPADQGNNGNWYRGDGNNNGYNNNGKGNWYRNDGTGPGSFKKYRGTSGDDQSNRWARQRLQHEYDEKNKELRNQFAQELSRESGTPIPRYEPQNSNVGGGGFPNQYKRVPADYSLKKKGGGAGAGKHIAHKRAGTGKGKTTAKTGKGAGRAKTKIKKR